MLWDLSVHNTSLPFDHVCCVDESELEMCQENAIKSYHRCCSFSFFFLQRFNLKLSPNTTSFDTRSTPIPENSMSTIFMFSFSPTHGIFRVHFNCRNFCFSGFFFVSCFDICTRFPTGSMSSPMGATSRSRVVGLKSALLCHHPCFLTAHC